jgi:integrase
MGVKRRGTVWHIDFRDANGVRIRQSANTTSKTEAQAILASLRTKVREGKFFDINQEPKLTIRELLERVDQRQRELGRRSYESHFKPYAKGLNEAFGDLPVGELTVERLQKYQFQRSQVVSKATVNRSLAILRMAYNLGIRWDLLKDNPVNRLEFFRETRGRVRFLSREEQHELLACCSPLLRDLVLVALRTGMRRRELLGLRKADVDFNRNQLILTRTKTDRSRQVPMTEEVRAVLSRLAFGREEQDRLFRNKRGEPYEQPRWAFCQALHKAGIKNFRFHDLRHSFASDLVQAGVDIFTVSKLLGHSNVRTTMIYAHLAPEHAKAEMARYENYLALNEGAKWAQTGGGENEAKKAS